jgi:hypothetical protein
MAYNLFIPETNFRKANPKFSSGRSLRKVWGRARPTTLVCEYRYSTHDAIISEASKSHKENPEGLVSNEKATDWWLFHWLPELDSNQRPID